MKTLAKRTRTQAALPVHQSQRTAVGPKRINLSADQTQDLLTCGRIFNHLNHRVRVLWLTARAAKIRSDATVPWKELRLAARKITSGHSNVEWIDGRICSLQEWWHGTVSSECRGESLFLANDAVNKKWISIEVAHRDSGRPVGDDETLHAIAMAEADELEYEVEIPLKLLEFDWCDRMEETDWKLFQIGMLLDRVNHPLPVHNRLTVKPVEADVLDGLVERHKRKHPAVAQRFLLPTLPLKEYTVDERQKVQEEIHLRCAELEVDPFEVAELGGELIQDARDALGSHFMQTSFGFRINGNKLRRSGFDEVVKFSERNYQLMKYFLSAGGSLVTLAELSDNWGSIGREEEIADSSIRGAICEVRRELKKLGGDIKNEGRNVGWRLAVADEET